MDTRATAQEIAGRLEATFPQARYELDWETPEQLLVATVLAGGASDAAVNALTPALFSNWPTFAALAHADTTELEVILRPLGLAAQKAARLKGIAKRLIELHGGAVPRSIDALTAIPGIGRKTANVVLTQAFGQASGIIVDVHVKRVAARLGLSAHEQPDAIEQDLMALLPPSAWVHFGAALILHGRYTCLAQAPKCHECSLKTLCPSVSEPVSKAPARAPTATWPEEFQVPKQLLHKHQPTIQPPSVDVPAEEPLPEDWQRALDGALSSPWYEALLASVASERAKATVYPPVGETFTALRLTPFDKVRVVILGQDPYHGAGQAHGLAFSVKRGVKAPPSLVNIFKELKEDLGVPVASHGCLEDWASRGVLLLNTALTVREAEPGSHAKLGWERLTDAIITALSARQEHVVFVLWGAHARKKKPLIDVGRHTIVEGAHPSPLSQKLFFGSRPFSQINAALEAHGQSAIDWSLS